MDDLILNINADTVIKGSEEDKILQSILDWEKTTIEILGVEYAIMNLTVNDCRDSFIGTSAIYSIRAKRLVPIKLPSKE